MVYFLYNIYALYTNRIDVLKISNWTKELKIISSKFILISL